MRFFRKQSVFILVSVLLSCTAVYGESNFDFFFKNNAQYKDVTVEEILSTDTFRLKGGAGETGETIRLIGLRAPKAPKTKTEDLERDGRGIVIRKPETPEIPFEEKAFESVRELLEGRRVRLEFDSEKKGADYETLAYAFLVEDGTFVNAEILRLGFAHLSIRPPNMKYADDLRKAYQEARKEKRGLQGQ